MTDSPTPPANDPDLEMQVVQSGDTVHQLSPSLTKNNPSNAIELASNNETREQGNSVASGDERKNGSDQEDCKTRGEDHFQDGPSTSTAMYNDDQFLDTSRVGWKLNSDKYFKKLADYIKSSLNRDMTKKRSRVHLPRTAT